MKASTLAKKLNALQAQREELQAKLRELKAAAAAELKSEKQAELLSQEQQLLAELEVVERSIAATERAHAEAKAKETEAAAEKWREELLPRAQAEIQEARELVVRSLAEARANWNQLRGIEQRWFEEWRRLGSPPPPPKPASKKSFWDFLNPSLTDQELRVVSQQVV